MATAVVEERELLKTISWFDGFVVALANPSFLITGLGGSALSLGGWGAVILWTVSVILGALAQLHLLRDGDDVPEAVRAASPSTPTRPGSGTSRSSARSPRSATGSAGRSCCPRPASSSDSSSSASGIRPPPPPTSWNHSWQFLGQTIYFSFPIALTAVIIIVIWAFNVSGMRPAVWVGYVTGALLMMPLAVMMFLPYITGDWHSSNLHNNISATAGSLGASSFTLVIVWLYAMCWSATAWSAAPPSRRSTTTRPGTRRRRCGSRRSSA